MTTEDSGPPAHHPSGRDRARMPAADEMAQLHALLAATRLERDDLARRRAAADDEPPVMTAGQVPLPLPDLPDGGSPLR